MIDYIEFVEYDDYLGLGVPTSLGGKLPPLSGFDSYPGEYDTFGVEKVPYYLPAQSYNQYTKVFNFVYPQISVTNESGFFAQAPSYCSFTLNQDAFLLANIVDPSGDKNSKYSKYVVRVFEDGVCIFEGLNIIDQMEYDRELQTITFQCYDFLVLLSDIKEKELNNEDWQFGKFMDDVINVNESCLKFILSFSAHQYFNIDPTGVTTEKSYYELDVTDILDSQFSFESEGSGSFITCIFNEENKIYAQRDIGAITITFTYANWEWLGFANLAEVRGYLLLVKWSFNNELGKYAIRLEGYDYDTNVISKAWIYTDVYDFHYTLKALGVKEPDTNTYRFQKFTVLGEEYAPAGIKADKDFYAYLDLENKTIVSLRFDMYYQVLNYVYYWDILASPDPAWLGVPYYDDKYIISPTFDFTPLQTAYATSLNLQTSEVIAERLLAYDQNLDRVDDITFPLDAGEYKKFKVANTNQDYAYYSFKAVFKPANRDYVVYDLRNFIYMYAYSYYANNTGQKLVYDKHFMWRHRTVLKVSGGIVISSVTTLEMANDLSESTPNPFTNPMFTEDYVDGTDSYTVLTKDQEYNNTDTGQRYFANLSIEDPGYPGDGYIGNVTFKTKSVALLSGYTYSDFMSWKIDASLTIAELLKGVLNFNNSTIRALLNNVYFEGRSNADISNGAAISNDDIIELKYQRILEESPDVSYLDKINQNDRDRLIVLIQDFYKKLFQVIKRRVPFEVSYVFNDYDLAINDIISIDDIQFRITSIQKIQDDIYQIEGWNIPYVGYGIRKAGETTIYGYGIRKEGDVTIYNYGLKGI